MVSITVFDDIKGHKLIINIKETDLISEDTGEVQHTVEPNWVTDLELMKAESTPMYKTAVMRAMKAFGLK